MGLRSSTRRPSGDMIRSMRMRICSSDSNGLPIGLSTPPRSMKVDVQPLTMISVTSSSSSNDCKGPSPTTSSSTSEITRSRSRTPRSIVVSALMTASRAGRNSTRACSTSGTLTIRATSANPTRSIIRRMICTLMARGTESGESVTHDARPRCGPSARALPPPAWTRAIRCIKLIVHHRSFCATATGTSSRASLPVATRP